MNALLNAIGKRNLIREIDDNCNLIAERSGVIVEDEIFRFFAGKCAFSHPEKILSLQQHCYTFIQPMYRGEYNENQRILSEGFNPRPAIYRNNPILQCLIGLIPGYFRDLKSLNNGTKIFEVDEKDYYLTAVYANDANFELYDIFIGPLRKAGFKIKKAIS